MTNELIVRVSQLGGLLATRMPDVLAAAIGLLESMAGVLDAARPERYEIERRIGTTTPPVARRASGSRTARCHAGTSAEAPDVASAEKRLAKAVADVG